jgi:hypothetical protein
MKGHWVAESVVARPDFAWLFTNITNGEMGHDWNEPPLNKQTRYFHRDFQVQQS